MRKLLPGSVVIAAFAMTGMSAAHAAGPVYNWAGWYGGFNGGWEWSQNAGGDLSGDNLPSGFQRSIAAGFFPGRIGVNYSGFTGGAQGGYNWQWGALVLGIEEDVNHANFRGSSTVPPLIPLGVNGPASFTLSQSIDWFATARGRLGVTPTDRLLLYVTGGLALGDVKTEYIVPSAPAGLPLGIFNGANSETKAGWTAGGGAEYALENHWSAKLEYLYYDLGSSSVRADPSGLKTFAFFGLADAQYRGSVLRGGINYRFDWGN
ncbi:MAG: outer membrane beta-barrel protein [Alphaproteobacteria bacterium]